MQIYGPPAYHVGVSVRTTGQGPNLVLIHGGSGSRTHWVNNVAVLAARFTVITPDLPGFGESASPSSDMSTADYLAWVAHAIHLAVNGQPFHLVGFSFGATVSAGITPLLKARGHAVSGLTLISPSGFGKPQGRTIKLEKIRKREDATLQEIREAAARNLGSWMLAKQPAADDPVIDLHLRNVSLAKFDSRDISYEASLIKNLCGLALPMQIFLGECDSLIFPSVEERKALLNRSVPRAQVDIIAGAGHWLQYEASSAVNAKINQFHL